MWTVQFRFPVEAIVKTIFSKYLGFLDPAFEVIAVLVWYDAFDVILFNLL